MTFGPRDDSERMALQERPKAYGRNPDIDELPSVDIHRPGESDVNPHRTVPARNQSSATALLETEIAIHNKNPLGDRCRKERPDRDKDIHSGE